MGSKKLIAESFKLENCSNYILSIQVALDGFSVCLYENEADKIIVWHEYPFITVSPYQLRNELKNLFNHEDLLNRSYKKVIISYDSPQQTAIPNSILTESDYDQIFNFTLDKNPSDIVLWYKPESMNETVLFLVPLIVKEFFVDVFPDAIFVPQGIGILNRAIASQNKVHIHKRQHHLQVTMVKDSKLKYHSINYVKNDDDCEYYVLLVLNQLNISSNIDIELSGMISNESNFVTKISRYYPSVRFSKVNDNIEMPSSMKNIPYHYHVNLIEQCLCE